MAVDLDQIREQQADPYSLDKISAPALAFTLRGLTWRISADPDVEVVAQMLRLEQIIRPTHQPRDLTPEDIRRIDLETQTAMVEAKELILDLIEEMPQAQELDRSHFRIGVIDVCTLFALITKGETVADAVAEAITAGVSGSRTADEFSDDELDAAERGEEEGGGPFGSTAPSSERFSS
jgi:hypothetical protein